MMLKGSPWLRHRLAPLVDLPRAYRASVRNGGEGTKLLGA